MIRIQKNPMFFEILVWNDPVFFFGHNPKDSFSVYREPNSCSSLFLLPREKITEFSFLIVYFCRRRGFVLYFLHLNGWNIVWYPGEKKRFGHVTFTWVETFLFRIWASMLWKNPKESMHLSWPWDLEERGNGDWVKFRASSGLWHIFHPVDGIAWQQSLFLSLAAKYTIIL